MTCTCLEDGHVCDYCEGLRHVPEPYAPGQYATAAMNTYLFLAELDRILEAADR